MSILLYQIGIFVTIQIATFYSRKARNTALILITMFTFLQVFISWLLILQLITIYISYQFSKNILTSNLSNTQNSYEKSNKERFYRQSNINGRVIFKEVDINDILEKKVIDNQIEDDIPYKVSLRTKFYYLKRGTANGPISGEKLLIFVKGNIIAKNCLVKREGSDKWEKRAFEIIELLKK